MFTAYASAWQSNSRAVGAGRTASGRNSEVAEMEISRQAVRLPAGGRCRLRCRRSSGASWPTAVADHQPVIDAASGRKLHARRSMRRWAVRGLQIYVIRIVAARFPGRPLPHHRPHRAVGIVEIETPELIPAPHLKPLVFDPQEAVSRCLQALGFTFSTYRRASQSEHLRHSTSENHRAPSPIPLALRP